MHTGQDEREAGMDMEALAEMAEIDMVEIQCSQDLAAVRLPAENR